MSSGAQAMTGGRAKVFGARPDLALRGAGCDPIPLRQLVPLDHRAHLGLRTCRADERHRAERARRFSLDRNSAHGAPEHPLVKDEATVPATLLTRLEGFVRQ